MYLQKSFPCQNQVSGIYMCWLDLTSSEEPPVCIGTPSTLLFDAVSFDLSCVVAISLEAHF